VLVTPVSLLLSSIVVTVVSFAISSSYSRKLTRRFQVSSKPSLVNLPSVAVQEEDEAVVVAVPVAGLQLAMFVEVHSEAKEVVSVEEDSEVLQLMVVKEVMAVLLSMAAALLNMVVLPSTAVEAMATPTAVLVVTLGGRRLRLTNQQHMPTSYHTYFPWRSHYISIF
jgi:hypothetical protein